MATKKAAVKEHSVKDRLLALYQLQNIDSEIDRLHTVRGELPLEVQDLEDDIAGLETRIDKFQTEIDDLDKKINEKKYAMQDSLDLIKKYEGQQENVRNNREYDALSKEIEFQGLEIQLAEKKIKEFKASIEAKNELADVAKEALSERKADLDHKQNELKEIIKETEKDEKSLAKKSGVAEKNIEDRLLIAYNRLRDNARNGLAVVPVERDACGGCHSKIPPQRQMDLASRKKIIVCEYCGRILVDEDIQSPVK
jgi:predicted  nucleic acid-binding Zn-ribbon protein